ncbi:MAG: beta-N-acetylhexosaminidase, partial [Bifidobacteriaceae bacterium]|nr:beta-N-acetylhexosaminidase [Bifidobacteriaceae bacterium]
AEPAIGRILPTPVEQVAGAGDPFRLTADSRVIVSDPDLVDLAETVAGQLRPATGYEVPVVDQSQPSAQMAAVTSCDIILTEAEVPELPADNDKAQDEGYKLVVSSAGASLTAPTEHGLFNAFQSLRQLLPAPIHSDTARLVAWTADPITVVDYPRYAHRGLQIDPARNFITVEEVKAIIDAAAAVKTNILHMHLSDSQSFRLEIKGPPEDPDRYKNLELHATGQMSGYTGCNGSGCVNGFYTQEDFIEIVEYANAQHIEILPELESPGHATANVVALGRDNVTCAGSGTNNFCADPALPQTANGLAFWEVAIAQLAAISPGPIIHIGGDEVSGMAAAHYEYWIGQMEAIINRNGKTIDSWNPGVDGYQNPDSINHYWSDYSPSGQHVTADWFDDGRPTIVTPENNVYLDFQYAGSPGRTPVTESLKAFNWDPEWFIEKYRNYNVSQVTWGGPKPEDIIGIEAPLWGENMRGGLDNEYMIFPRFAGIAEKAWSPKSLTQDYAAYQARLEEQGVRWSFQNVNFGTIPETDWGLEAAGSILEYGPDLTLTDVEVAALAAPEVDHGTVTATVDWGDGAEAAAAVIAGRDFAAASRRGRALITATSSHTYARPGVYNGTVTFTDGDDTWAAPFLVQAIPEGVLDLEASVSPRCVAGKIYLYTSVKNVDSVTMDISTVTAYGSKDAANVTPGRSGSGSFATRLAAIPAGSVDFDASDPGGTATRTVTVQYGAFSCG